MAVRKVQYWTFETVSSSCPILRHQELVNLPSSPAHFGRVDPAWKISPADRFSKHCFMKRKLNYLDWKIILILVSSMLNWVVGLQERAEMPWGEAGHPRSSLGKWKTHSLGALVERGLPWGEGAFIHLLCYVSCAILHLHTLLCTMKSLVKFLPDTLGGGSHFAHWHLLLCHQRAEVTTSTVCSTNQKSPQSHSPMMRR